MNKQINKLQHRIINNNLIFPAKRTHSVEQLQSEPKSGMPYYGSLSASKRGRFIRHTHFNYEVYLWDVFF